MNDPKTITDLEGVPADAVRAPAELEPAAEAEDDDRPLTADQQVEAYHRIIKNRGRLEVVARDLKVSVERLARYVATKRAERRANAETDALVRINRQLRDPGGRPIDYVGAAGRRRVW